MPVRTVRRTLFLLIVAASIAGWFAPRAEAFELFDGRLQAHGFFESQMRVLNEDYSEDWDVAQWYQVFDLELEFDIIEDTTFGIDLLSAFVRIEARYDCVYSRGCGMFRSMNAFGDRSKSLPRRLSNGDDIVQAGTLFIRNDGRLSGGSTDPVPLEDLAGFRIIADTDPQTIFQIPGFDTTVVQPDLGDDCISGDADFFNCFVGVTPFQLTFDRFKDFRFTQLTRRDGSIRRLGPWLPKNKVNPIASLSDVPNPLDTSETNELLFLGTVDANGNPVDWDGKPPQTTQTPIATNPTTEVVVNLSFAGMTGSDNFKFPLIGQSLFSFDADGNATSTLDLDFPAGGALGSGARPYRPITAYDRDLARFDQPDLESIELNGECTDTAGGGRACFFEELDQTLEYNPDGTLADIGDFNKALGKFYQERRLALRTACEPGQLGCFAQNFEGEMRDDGWDVQCSAANPNCGIDLQRIVDGAFEEMSQLACLHNEWNCTDVLRDPIRDEIDALVAEGAVLTCPVGGNCALQFARHLTRFGGRFVQSSSRPDSVARGGFVPSAPLARMIDKGRLSTFPEHFSEGELAFNRGSSQQDEKELKEAYLDIELLDSRLWIRAGKQSIVWGKTELFRTTDQFNPQDLALASLPSLEESRINLWALRGVYSLYEVGPLDDVRLEIAANYDEFESADLGQCGEAFTFNIVCEIALGAFLHGQTGIGVAGVKRPPDPWSSWQGWEVGGRAEWRWDRFSFALTDFWGYTDLPVATRLSSFQRNVDPMTGRPRRMGASGPCGSVLDDTVDQDPITTRQLLFVNNTTVLDAISDPSVVSPSCLRPGPTRREPGRNVLQEIEGIGTLPTNNSYRAFIEGNALNEHHANLNLFTWICGTTVGFSATDPKSCALTVFGSTADLGFGEPVALVIGSLLGGQPKMNDLIAGDAGRADDFIPVSIPTVELESDISVFSRDLESLGCWDPTSPNTNDPGTFPNPGIGCGNANGKLGKSLTPEQEALVGCGPFFGTNCDFSGIDLLNAEASAILQSWVGIEGSDIALARLQENVKAELRAQGRNENEIRVDYFRTDGWKNILEREGIVLDEYLLQPGTVKWKQAGLSGPICTTDDLPGNSIKSNILPGCRGLLDNPASGTDQDVLATIANSSASQADQGVANGFVHFSDDVDFFFDPNFFLYHPFDPTGDYEDVACAPNGVDAISACKDSLAGFEDSPELHNQWENGYNISVDGNPFTLRLRDFRGSVNRPNELRLPGFIDDISKLNKWEKITPNCYNCNELLANFRPGTDDLLGQGQPFTGDVFASEIAGFSYNLMMMLVAFDGDFQDIIHTIGGGRIGGASEFPQPEGNFFRTLVQCHESVPGARFGAANNGANNDRLCRIERRRFAVHYAYSGDEWGNHDPNETFKDEWIEQVGKLGPGFGARPGPATDELDYQYVENKFLGRPIWENGSNVETGEVIKAGAHCSFITPQNCDTVQSFFAIAGVQSRQVKAAGNGQFGRRTFLWHSGGEVFLDFDRRNVLGLSTDFAEDVTKSNFSVEFTWFNDFRVSDGGKRSGNSNVDDFNLTISMDRPTFINFLNPNNTFFLNTQWFIQYRKGYHKSMPSNGPYNFLGLIFIQTGYFQDRLLPGLILVYDVKSNSGAALPRITYRYSENFSVTFGLAIFNGREQFREMPINGIAPASNQRGPNAYQVPVENGLALVRDRDEIFMRLRYTF